MNLSLSKMRSFRYRNGTGSRRVRENTSESIPLDLSQDLHDLLMSIFKAIGSKSGAGNTKNLGHLNNLILILCNCEDAMSKFSMEDVLLCLKPALVSDVKEVRAACIRALRYLVNDAHSVSLLTKLHLDCFIIKCLDISHFNEVERIQVLRLIRKILLIGRLERQSNSGKGESIIPKSFVLCVLSISSDGAVERDRVYRTCLAILCELVVVEPLLVVENGGMLVLLRAILECHMYRRINEALCISLGILLNHPASRNLLNLEFNFSAIFAPYTDVMYRLHADVEESQLKEEKEMRFSASKMAIVSVLRSWSGLLHLSQSSTLKSFLNTLLIPNSGIKHATLSVLFEIFCMNEPTPSSNFAEALTSIGPKVSQESWQLTNLFVVGEGKWFLPSLCNEHLDLTNCYMAVLLAIFIESGIVQVMVEVIMGSNDETSITASIFLGGLLNMCDKLHSIPQTAEMWAGNVTSSCKECLPNLMKIATSKTATKEELLQASVTVSRLQRIHSFLKHPPSSHSTYFDELILRVKASSTVLNEQSDSLKPLQHMDNGEEDFSFSDEPSSLLLRRNRSITIVRSFSSEQTISRIKETKVLVEKDFSKWDWEAVSSFLIEGWTKKAPSLKEPRFIGSDDTEFQFAKRLASFYTPQEGEFCKLDRSKDGENDKEAPYVQSGCHLIRYLSYTAGEGMKILSSLLKSITDYLLKLVKDTDGMKKATSSYLSSCAREYFLLLGSITMWNHGNEILRKNGVFKFLFSLANDDIHESLLKLVVSSLSYLNESPSYRFLKKVLVYSNENARLYATSYLRVLLRAKMFGFISWGVNLLTTQLYDSSQTVANEALNVLSEACSNQEYLNVIVGLRPSVLHLGEKGALLVCRFASHPMGFDYLMNTQYISRELDRWWDSANDRYVTRVEEMLNISLTCFEKPNQQGGFVRRSGIKKVVHPVHVPSHLYGELCQHNKGIELLEKRSIVPKLIEKLNNALEMHESFTTSVGDEFNVLTYQKIADQLSQIKSCLWALSHIGCSILGLELLKQHGVLEMIQNLAEHSPVYSIRGTCFYCLSIASQTVSGAEELKKLGWQSTLRKVWCGLPARDSSTVSLLPRPKTQPSPARTAHSSDKSSLSALSSVSHQTPSPAEKSSGISDKIEYTSESRSDCKPLQKEKSNSMGNIPGYIPLQDDVHPDKITCEDCLKCCDMNLSSKASNSLDTVFCKQCGTRKPALHKRHLDIGQMDCRISLSAPTISKKVFRSDQLSPAATDDNDHCVATDSPRDQSWCFNKIEDVSAMKYIVERFSRYKTSIANCFGDLESVDQPMTSVSKSVQHAIADSMGFVGIAVPKDISSMFEPRTSQTSSDVLVIPPVQRRVKKFYSKHAKYFANSDEARSPTSVQSSTAAFLEDVKLANGDQSEIMNKEIIKLVTNLGSSIGNKADETALLILKEKFPKSFNSTTLYYAVSEILGEYNFRLTARRFIQELFHDMTFVEVFEEAKETLRKCETVSNS